MPWYWVRFFFGLVVSLGVLGGSIATNLARNSGPPSLGLILVAVGESLASVVALLPGSIFGAVFQRQSVIGRIQRTKILARDTQPDSPDLLKAFGRLEAIEEQLG
jgi:hypothetical protein